jgi:hypothetical protein
MIGDVRDVACVIQTVASVHDRAGADGFDLIVLVIGFFYLQAASEGHGAKGAEGKVAQFCRQQTGAV